MSDLAPRVPSGYQLQEAVSAFQQLTDRLLNDPDLINDEDVLAAALAVRDDTTAILDGLIRAEQWSERRIEEADTERKYWVARKARYEARKESIRATIVQVMQALGVKRHRGVERLATLTERSVLTIKVPDPAKLPDAYRETEVVTVYKPRMELIRADVVEGVVIEGVVVSNSPPILTLR